MKFCVCARSNILSNWPQVGQVNDEEIPYYNIILNNHAYMYCSFQEEDKSFETKTSTTTTTTSK